MDLIGIDPFSKHEAYLARNLRDHKLQWALLQFFKPDNYFEVRKTQEQADRAEVIGGDCHSPTSPSAPANAADIGQSPSAGASLLPP